MPSKEAERMILSDATVNKKVIMFGIAEIRIINNGLFFSHRGNICM